MSNRRIAGACVVSAALGVLVLIGLPASFVVKVIVAGGAGTLTGLVAVLTARHD